MGGGVSRYFRSMRYALLPILLVTVSARAQPGAPSLELLKNWMIGSFTSAEQAAQDTDYYDIELEMRRIWLRDAEGIWLYVEQAVAGNKEKPYRQRIYHLQQRDDSTFTSTVFDLDSMHLFIGAYEDVSRFNGLKPVDAKPLEGCTLLLHWRNGHFVGGTNGADCKNAWGEAVYATSEVDIGPEGMTSWDRGYNETDEQVWGAEKGGYRFLKKR